MQYSIKVGLNTLIESFDAVVYTCIFLLPGFIIKSVIDTLIPSEKSNDIKYFFSCLSYSIINCAIWSWIYILITKLQTGHSVVYWLLFLIVTIVGAVILALSIGIIKQKKLINLLFFKFKINKKQPEPTAWDYFFAKQEEAWVIVTLKSGKTVYGKYSVNSFASSIPEERDIYIEKTYLFDEEKGWIEDKRSKGILIFKEEIETIEFFS